MPSSASNTAVYALDTERFAARNNVKGQSVRSRVSRTGSYFGVHPKRLINGRLAWPDVQIEAAAAADDTKAPRHIARNEATK